MRRRWKEALEARIGLTQPIRTAMFHCKGSDCLSVKSRELMAAAHIVCTPGQLQRDYANKIRGNLPAMKSDREIAKHYSLMAIAAMVAILLRIGNLPHEEKLRAQYEVAIKAEKERVKELAHSSVAA